MATTVAEAFEKRQMTRDDGVNVLPRTMITVAALEAGYCLPSPMIDDAVVSTKYPGQMTQEEFVAFCESHKDNFLSAEDMARAVIVVAPSNVITRGSLQQIAAKSSKKENAITDEEADTLFATLDDDNKGAISGDDLMRALYGEEGPLILAEQRKAALPDAQRRIAEQEKKAEQEREERAAVERAATEKASREAEEAAGRKNTAEREAAEAAKEKKEEAKEETKKKEKAKGCC